MKIIIDQWNHTISCKSETLLFISPLQKRHQPNAKVRGKSSFTADTDESRHFPLAVWPFPATRASLGKVVGTPSLSLTYPSSLPSWEFPVKIRGCRSSPLNGMGWFQLLNNKHRPNHYFTIMCYPKYPDPSKLPPGRLVAFMAPHELWRSMAWGLHPLQAGSRLGWEGFSGVGVGKW